MILARNLLREHVNVIAVDVIARATGILCLIIGVLALLLEITWSDRFKPRWEWLDRAIWSARLGILSLIPFLGTFGVLLPLTMCLPIPRTWKILMLTCVPVLVGAFVLTRLCRPTTIAVQFGHVDYDPLYVVSVSSPLRRPTVVLRASKLRSDLAPDAQGWTTLGRLFFKRLPLSPQELRDVDELLSAIPAVPGGREWAMRLTLERLTWSAVDRLALDFKEKGWMETLGP